MRTLQHASWVLAAMAAAASLAQAQGVVDLARRERQRQSNQESTTVLNRDSPRGAPADAKGTTTAPAPAAPQTEAVTRPATTTGPTDNKGRDEKYWRGVFEKARQDLKRTEERVKVVDLKMNDLVSQLRRESVYTREMALRAEMDKTQKDQVLAHKELADVQQKIRELEEELRRSGGLPGWAR